MRSGNRCTRALVRQALCGNSKEVRAGWVELTNSGPAGRGFSGPYESVLWNREVKRSPCRLDGFWRHPGVGSLVLDSLLCRNQYAEANTRSAVHTPRLVVAAAVREPGLTDPARVMASALSMAHQAKSTGADAILVWPSGVLGDRPDHATLLIEYHAAIPRACLPLT